MRRSRLGQPDNVWQGRNGECLQRTYIKRRSSRKIPLMVLTSFKDCTYFTLIYFSPNLHRLQMRRPSARAHDLPCRRLQTTTMATHTTHQPHCQGPSNHRIASKNDGIIISSPIRPNQIKNLPIGPLQQALLACVRMFPAIVAPSTAWPPPSLCTTQTKQTRQCSANASLQRPSRPAVLLSPAFTCSLLFTCHLHLPKLSIAETGSRSHNFLLVLFISFTH